MGLVAHGIYGLSGNSSEASIIHLALSVLAAIFVYVVLLWILGEIKENEKKMALELLYKFSGKGYRQI
jgi:zinc transporter ZupT